jgi:hypothetical protein
MSEEILDQQLEWDGLGGFCQLWNANAQTFRPAFDYDARSLGVLLARIDNDRRGRGVIKLERATDPGAEGTVFAQWEWHTAELGAPGSPVWISRGFGVHRFKSGELYRIVVHTIPGWEIWNEDKQQWELQDTAAAIQWARWGAGSRYPRGTYQYGLNYWSRYADVFRDLGYPDDFVHRYEEKDVGSWRSAKNTDNAFYIRATAIAQYSLSITISPPEGGSVDVDPQKGVYSPGEKVTLSVSPSDGYEFTRWSGDLDSTDPVAVLVMDSAKFIMAYFEGSNIPDVPIINDIIKWLEAELSALYAWIQAQLLWLVETIEAAMTAVLELALAPIKVAVFKLEEKIPEIWSWLSDTIPGMLSWIEEKVVEIWNWTTDWIPGTLTWIRDKLEETWDWITDTIPTTLTWIKDKLDDAYVWISSTIPETLEWLKGKLVELDELLGGIVDDIKKIVGETIGQVWEFILEIKDQVLAFFADPLTWILDNVLEPIVTSFNTGLERALSLEAEPTE